MNIIMALICILISSVCYSAEQRMYIFFINGVNATADEASVNLNKLEDLLNHQSNAITWDVLYNATHGLMKSDLLDYVKQKRAETKRLSIDSYTNYYINHNSIDCCNNAQDYNVIKDSIKGKYLEDTGYVGKNLKDIVNQFHNKVKGDTSNVYVLIIAHSQGNEYANQLWDYLVNAENFSRDRIAIFSIATPSHSILSFVNPYAKFKYVTADNDHVINGARILPGLKPMPANVHLNDCKDYSCHSLVNSYLFDKGVSGDICRGIRSYISLWLNEQPLC